MTTMKRRLSPGSLAVAVLMTVVLVPVAQADPPMKHGDHGAQASDDNEAARAYRDANDRMHQAMTSSYSGNADVDFARGMIPHHQGAIDMARVELRYGSDPSMRMLAEQVINAQQAEIETLRNWLEQHDSAAR
ncbi:hypothetical protein C7446_0861 [Kushneria sinocarnis]|uniref:DUF305 domain-containing protein n=1 Tax=Kushneria sinocarnis TaxID=595502 RepID=A0A420WZY9_9GAMM|nr:DUF305 domain-containing protein [Kushneria sinocarnis]RKR06862.1 hypothetical protein C7446_0861 [Kushneria sinocarnis]